MSLSLRTRACSPPCRTLPTLRAQLFSVQRPRLRTCQLTVKQTSDCAAAPGITSVCGVNSQATTMFARAGYI